jgi:hypothetical protein
MNQVLLAAPRQAATARTAATTMNNPHAAYEREGRTAGLSGPLMPGY